MAWISYRLKSAALDSDCGIPDMLVKFPVTARRFPVLLDREFRRNDLIYGAENAPSYPFFGAVEAVQLPHQLLTPRLAIIASGLATDMFIADSARRF